MPQGYILGPLLFTLLINDIDANLKMCEMALHADDSVLYVADRKCETINKKLNSDLEQTVNWLIENNLVVELKSPKQSVSSLVHTRKLWDPNK